MELLFGESDRVKITFVDTLYLRKLAYPAALLPELEAGVSDNSFIRMALSPLSRYYREVVTRINDT